MKKLQLICFEVSKKCNYSDKHFWCPASKARFFDRSCKPNINQQLSFLDSCVMAGFKGKVGFHYYNEPTLELEKCIELSVGIKERKLETVLWTNGSYEGSLDGMFDNIFVTQYPNANEDSCTRKIEYKPDDRIKIYDAEETQDLKPCYRPELVEIIVDACGYIHICCADWKNEVRIGSICKDDHDKIIENFNRYAEEIKNGKLPSVCLRCQNLEKSPAIYDPDFEF